MRKVHDIKRFKFSLLRDCRSDRRSELSCGYDSEQKARVVVLAETTSLLRIHYGCIPAGDKLEAVSSTSASLR